jgi:hypothetical protein
LKNSKEYLKLLVECDKLAAYIGDKKGKGQLSTLQQAEAMYS